MNHTHYSEDDLADMLLFVEHPHVYTGEKVEIRNIYYATTELNYIQAEAGRPWRGHYLSCQVGGYPILDLDQILLIYISIFVF